MVILEVNIAVALCRGGQVARGPQSLEGISPTDILILDV